MKKTHLYGAVAATMLLAPVTANVLAEEGETPSEALGTQNSEEFTEQLTLTPQEEKQKVNPVVIDESESKEVIINQKKDEDLDSIKDIKESESKVVFEEKSNTFENSTVNEGENENSEEMTLVESNSKTSLFQYGKGTEEDPYQVSSATELDSVRYDLNAYYVQTAHIDLKGINWTPIGMETETSATQSFKGVFDGANFAISNLTIREKTEPIYEQFYGLFAKNEGILKNIQLLDVDVAIDTHNIKKLTSPTPRMPVGPIYGGVFTSGLTGWDQGSIDNCTVSGNIVNQLTKVSDRMYYVGYTGGIVGYSTPKTLIKNCKNYANIKVSYDNKAGTNTTVGGIVGQIGKTPNKDHAYTLLKDCTNYGNITVENSNYCQIGGLAGFIAGNSENLVNYGDIRLDNSRLENAHLFLAIGSILGEIQHTTFYPETGDYNDQISFPSKTSNIVNFGKIDAVSSYYTLSDPHYLIYVNGLVGMIGGLEINGEYSGIENGYNLGDILNFKWIDANRNYTDLDLDIFPIYRITDATTSFSYNDPSSTDRNVSIKNCYSVNDFKINGKIVEKFIGSDLENGANVKREELSSLVQTQFPDIKILESGESIELPTNKDELETVFESENYYVLAQSSAGFRDVQIKMEETKSDNNFGYSDQYDTYGYHLYLVNKDGNPVNREGSFYGWFKFPEEFNMRILRGKMINAATNEVIWEEDMGWYRLDEISFDEENLDLIFVVAEKKKEESKPEEPVDPSAKFEGENYKLNCLSTEGFKEVTPGYKELKSHNNFGYSEEYETEGFILTFVDKDGNTKTKAGDFSGSFKIPEKYLGKDIATLITVPELSNQPYVENVTVGEDTWIDFANTIITEKGIQFVIAVKKETQNPDTPKPETPIKTEATFTQDGYQVKAESKEDLTGLQIVINEVEADNNFGLSSDYQTIGYDIHFENEKGEEVNRTGNFTIRIPIPAEFVGKEVRLFHKENKESDATDLPFKIVDGKYYEFETTSFSWFIVASQTTNTEPETPSNPEQPTQPGEEKPEQPKPSDPTKQPTTPADEANKPQEKPIDTTVKPTTNNQTIKVVQVKAEETKQTEESDAKHSPNTGIAIHKTSSLFASLLGMIGLGSVVGKRRKF